MKNLILLIILLGNLTACSTESESSDKVSNENKAPSAPTLYSPEDNLFCTVNTLDFQWSSCIDPDGDKITYIFELSTLSDFSDEYFQTETSALAFSRTVSKGRNYYWRVRAKDDLDNYSAYSPISNFYTEGEEIPNTLPSVPQLINPIDNSIVNDSEIELKWEARDNDGDELKYNLYFGTSETPELLIQNLKGNTYFVNNLKLETTYYWQIKAIDESNGVSIGEVWRFQTK